ILGCDLLPLPDAINPDGKEVVSLTSMASTTLGDSMALGMLRRSHFQPGTEFMVDARAAKVVGMPE
ncbi:MAG: hypothetical protein ACK5PZ_03310, partial [Pirellula sp.]